MVTPSNESSLCFDEQLIIIFACLLLIPANFIGGLSIDTFDILAVKSGEGQVGGDVAFGVHTTFQTLPNGTAAARQFCQDTFTVVQSEAGTVNWLCGEVPEANSFVILASFVDLVSVN